MKLCRIDEYESRIQEPFILKYSLPTTSYKMISNFIQTGFETLRQLDVLLHRLTFDPIFS